MGQVEEVVDNDLTTSRLTVSYPGSVPWTPRHHVSLRSFSAVEIPVAAGKYGKRDE